MILEAAPAPRNQEAVVKQLRTFLAGAGAHTRTQVNPQLSSTALLQLVHHSAPREEALLEYFCAVRCSMELCRATTLSRRGVRLCTVRMCQRLFQGSFDSSLISGQQLPISIGPNSVHHVPRLPEKAVHQVVIKGVWQRMTIFIAIYQWPSISRVFRHIVLYRREVWAIYQCCCIGESLK